MSTEDVSVKKEEDIKDTNTSTSEGEEKDLKIEEVWVSGWGKRFQGREGER